MVWVDCARYAVRGVVSYAIIAVVPHAEPRVTPKLYGVLSWMLNSNSVVVALVFMNVDGGAKVGLYMTELP